MSMGSCSTFHHMCDGCCNLGTLSTLTCSNMHRRQTSCPMHSPSPAPFARVRAVPLCRLCASCLQVELLASNTTNLAATFGNRGNQIIATKTLSMQDIKQYMTTYKATRGSFKVTARHSNFGWLQVGCLSKSFCLLYTTGNVARRPAFACWPSEHRLWRAFPL